jgi:GH43 family beta-xylosidase
LKPPADLIEFKMKETAKHFLLGVLVWLPVAAISAASFTDPTMQGQDPEVEFANGLFNLVQSDGCNIHLRQSATMGGLATALDQIILSPGCSNVWAPEIHWFSNRWYLYYSLGVPDHPNHRVYAAQSQGTDATGPYTIKDVLFNDYWNIDGSVFTATNGGLYFIFSGSPSGSEQDIYIAPMSNPYTLSGAPVMISAPTQSWEVNGAPPAVNEGPFGFTHAGRTFIDYSASGCWTDDYCLGLLTLTGTNLLDPNSWTKSGPVFSKQPGAYGPGHNGIFTDASGQDWNIYHANNLTGQGCGGYRQLRIQRLAWNANGLPVYGSPVPLGSWISDDTNFLDAQIPLTETNGTTATNLICGPPGNLVGTPVWLNPGLHLNGVTDYVNCGPAIGNDVQTALTLAVWIRADAFVDWAAIIAKGTNTEPYAMQIWHDGSLRFTANWGGPGGGVGGGSWNSNFKMNTNVWCHVAITYDGTAIRFYLNGQLDANPPPASLQLGVVNEPIILGADLPGGHEFFPGAIRDARVYGRALSGAEILALVNQPPVITSAPGAYTLLAGRTLNVTNTATDPDLPPQTLTWSLLPVSPAGATLNPSNGIFSWRPGITQSPSTNAINLQVTDNGKPPMSATQTFTVTVQRPQTPALNSASVSNGLFSYLINGDAGPDYVLETSSNLANGSAWTPVATNLSANPPFTWTDPAGTGANQKFYRVRLAP